MSVFGNYARYYDLLYRDKDYAGEAAYVAGLLQKNGIGGGSVLELGCGTGKHALLLARRGYSVCGVDRSSDMLEQARARASGEHGDARLEFLQSDICELKTGKKYDAVISLFHVVSYLTDNESLRRFLRVVRDHLKEGGVFVFDCWYGPAVLALKPAVRVLRLEDECVSIVRLAEPELDTQACTVRVKYQILIEDKVTHVQESVSETHDMRYLFHPELKLLASEAGLQLVTAEEWMTGRAPDVDTWGVCFVAKG